MGWLQDLFKKKDTITQTVIPAETQPSVKFVDVGTKDTVRTGGYTIVGGESGGGGYATQLEGVIPSQVQGLEAASGRTTTVVGGDVRRLTPQQIAQVQARNNQQQFSGTVEEFNVSQGQQTPVGQKFFVRGQQTGQIIINPETGERYAQVSQPSRFQFVNQTRGTVQDIILGEEGATITEKMGVSFPSLFPESQQVMVKPFGMENIKTIRDDLGREVDPSKVSGLFLKIGEAEKYGFKVDRKEVSLSDLTSEERYIYNLNLQTSQMASGFFNKPIEEIQKSVVFIPQSSFVSPTQLKGWEKEVQLEYRQTLPVGERLKIAYESALPTGAKFNVYSVGRVGMELLSVGYEKSGLYKGIKRHPALNSILNAPVSPVGFERFVTGVFYLAPISPTTAQIERELFSVTKVGVVGTSQQTATGATKVNARFIAERAGRNVQGVVDSTTKYLTTTNKGDIFLTGTRGRVINIGAEFPTGRWLIKGGSQFQTTELSKINIEGILFRSRGKGVSVQGGVKSLFDSISVGVQRGELFGQVGYTLSPSTNDAISFGLIKNKPGVSKNIIELFGIKSTGVYANIGQISQTQVTQVSRQVLNSIAQEGTRSTIRGTNLIPIETPLNFLSSIVAGSSKSVSVQNQKVSPIVQQIIVKQDIIQKPININLSGTNVKTKDIGGSGQTSILLQGESNKQLPKQISISIQSDLQKQILKQVSIYTQSQKQRQLLKQVNISSQLQGNKTINININPPPTGKIELFPFLKFPSPKLLTASRAGFPVFTRRFGKWKSLGLYPSSKIALNVGKEYSLKTLGRSFYIGGKQPKSILPQFRTKMEKGIGQIFVQKTKYPGGSTLGTKSEIAEIQFFRGMSTKRRKKK